MILKYMYYFHTKKIHTFYKQKSTGFFSFSLKLLSCLKSSYKHMLDHELFCITMGQPFFLNRLKSFYAKI